MKDKIEKITVQVFELYTKHGAGEYAGEKV